MILRCQTSMADDRNDVTEESILDVACQAVTTEFSPLQDGLYAKYNSGPTSVYWFFLITAIIAFISYKLLDARREGILNEVYSKISIIKNIN